MKGRSDNVLTALEPSSIHANNTFLGTESAASSAMRDNELTANEAITSIAMTMIVLRSLFRSEGCALASNIAPHCPSTPTNTIECLEFHPINPAAYPEYAVLWVFSSQENTVDHLQLSYVQPTN